MNWHGMITIYVSEMVRMWRTLAQSVASPVISTALYFIVFGSAIGKSIESIDGIAYGSFIVPGLIMLTVLTQSLSNAAFGIYFPKFTGTIFEVLSAPITTFEILCGYVGAATTKSLILALLILGTATFFVPIQIHHPVLMVLFLVATCLTFSMLGFIIGIIANSFEQLQLVPLLLVTPLVFLGGTFYSINMLPPLWQKISLFNPVVYLVSGFRWSFYGSSDVTVTFSLIMVSLFLIISYTIIHWIFKTGYRLKH